MSPPDDDGYAVSYKVLQRGTAVRASDGVDVGTVRDVLENKAEHIFDGLVIRTSGGGGRSSGAASSASSAAVAEPSARTFRHNLGTTTGTIHQGEGKWPNSRPSVTTAAA